MRKTAPVQGDLNLPRGEIPWQVHALAAKEYNKRHPQTAEQLADRGGFGWSELVACLRGEYTSEGIIKASEDLRKIKVE